MEDIWTLFCGQSNCSKHNIGICSSQFVAVSNPTSCVNHIFRIFVDALLLTLVLLSMICRTYFKKVGLQYRTGCLSALQILSAILNTCLGLVYVGLGIFNLEEKLKNEQTMLPVHGWIVFLFQGFAWLLVGLMASLGGNYLPKTLLQSLSIVTFFSAGILCFLSLASFIYHEATVQGILDVLSFLGAAMILLCTYKGYNNQGNRESDNGSTLYTLLNGEAGGDRVDPATRLTPFEKAGLLSKISFWWLNPLMVLGGKKTLHEEDIPQLRVSDGAEACYLQFLDQFTKQKEDISSFKSSVMWTIIACNQNEILISGFFALMSILSLSAGPLLLNAFIEVAVGKEAFRYEGYVLSISLFLLKVLQSLSQRQWYFRSKLVGVNVRSLLTALIYRKQLKLSSDARKIHSGGEIMNYAIVDAYRIGEFPLRFHKTWTTSLQICIAVVILIRQVGLATIGSLLVLIILALCNLPLAKLQQRFQSKLMAAQDERLKVCTEILVNMKVLKLYSWETHFRTIIEGLRNVEYEWLSRVYFGRGFRTVLYWICPVPVFAATFGSCYFLKLPLNASNVFTFVATLRLLQDPIAEISDVVGVLIEARVAFTRIVRFLEAPELQTEDIRRKSNSTSTDHAILMMSANLSWKLNQSKPILNNISLDVQPGEKIAICGKVGSGKSTLLAAVLGEVAYIDGTVEVFGKLTYVSQKPWIKTGTIRDNVLFGSAMDELRYQETLRRCSLVKDLELLPYGDMTEVGERGVNLSGGQKQRVQLARALYRDADIYLLDDPFSAVDAQTATSLFNEYVMEALSRKTVLLVTHQVEFLPAFQRCLLMSDGQIIQTGPYHELLASSQEFLDLINAHKETAGTERLSEVGSSRGRNNTGKTNIEIKYEAYNGDQLIKQEEREMGDTGIKPYMLYLDNKTGYMYFWVAVSSNLTFVLVQIAQNYWLASGVDNPHISTLKLIVVYLIISTCSTLFIPLRTFAAVRLGMQSSKSLFFRLMNSLFRAPMSFYDSTPLGRILSRITSDLSIVDLDISHIFILTLSPTINAVANLGLLAAITPQVLLLYVPVFYMTVRLQIYYFKTAKELMRINGTTKSLVTNHLAESVAGATTIRAFEEEECFFTKILNHLDTNSSPFFHNFAANEWLILRLEILNAVILSSAALCLVILPPGTFNSGIVGMALAYGLSLSTSVVYSIQFQCTLANSIVSVERLNQYIHLPSEALEVIEDCRPPENWPSVGKVEISNLKIRYRPEAPLVLRGISCTFEGGDKIGIVGRTGSGKTTMIGALFRLVEPADGKIIVDNVDICSIGLHDLRSHFGIIPQEPTLFNGTVRFNLDPLCQHTDAEIWEVLSKCQLKESVQKRKQGLESLVVEDGLDWSMGQRQLFCLGRALLRRNKVLILDEATASIDNATDMILQKTIRAEFCGSTVITVAHRIPTVMDCTKVLAISDGKLVEYDEPKKLMNKEGSLFSQLVNEYWSQIHSSESP